MDEKNIKQIHKIFISEIATTFICGYIIYLLSTTLASGLDMRLIIPGVILIFVLLQGCVYWFFRDREANGKPYNSAIFLKIYGFLKKLTPYIILLYPLFLLYLLLFNRELLFVPFNVFGLILLFFAVIEYINYYYFNVNIGNMRTRIPSDLAVQLDKFEKGRS
ncbi:MAG: hypothetical protein RR614_03205 [Eubacterium sp.]